MKSFISSAGVILMVLIAYSFGRWEGARSSQERAILVGAQYATTACVAQNLVELRQVTRAIEAKNRKPIVVDCHADRGGR